jgi:hypothetical protein
MNPRRIGLIFALGLLLAYSPNLVRGQGTKFPQITPVYQEEGRQRVFFSATCTGSSWTLVVSSDSISRSTLITALAANSEPVCLSSSTATGSCSATTQGPELPASSSLTDYSHGEWYCQSYSGTQYVKGYRTRDKGDYGNIGAPSVQ